MLSRTPGIAAVNVNLALETAHVEYTPGNISPREIMEKVSSIGYKASLKEDRKDHVDRRGKEIQHKSGNGSFLQFFRSHCYGRWRVISPSPAGFQHRIYL